MGNETSQGQTIVTEQKLLDLYKSGKNESFYQKQSRLAEIEGSLLQFNQKFMPALTGNIGGIYANEDPLPNSLQSERSYLAKVDIMKNFDFGISAGIGYQYQQLRFGKYRDPNLPLPKNLYTPVTSASLNISLWKNVLGVLDRLQLAKIMNTKKVIEIKNRIVDIAVISKIRELYWNYVLTEDILKVNQSLLFTALDQKKQLARRSLRGIADRADTTRNKATIAKREAEIEKVKAAQLLIMRYVLQILGTTQQNSYKVKGQLNQSKIDQCIQKISAHKTPNKKWTIQENLIAALNDSTRSANMLIENTTDSEVTLSGILEGKGLDDKSDAAVEESFFASKANFQLLLGVTIPLGDTGNQKRRAEMQTNIYRKNSELTSIRANMNSLHLYTVSYLKSLSSNLRSIYRAREAMEISIKEQIKKFNQGRLDYLSLLKEQEGLTQIQAQVANLQNDRVQSLLTYFSIFNNTPCEFNLLATKSSQ